MRSSNLFLLFCLALGARAQDLLILADGIDLAAIAEYDFAAQPLAPTLREFQLRSDGGVGEANLMGDGTWAPRAEALRALREGLVGVEMLDDPTELLVRLQAGEHGPWILRLREDRLRDADDELLTRSDPTPWQNDHPNLSAQQQRVRRLQRGQALWRLQRSNRPPRSGAAGNEARWLARYRAAELERELSALLRWLLSEEATTSVLLSATHGSRLADADISADARRIPLFGLRYREPEPSAGPHWSVQWPLRPGESRFARREGAIVLRVVDGRATLFDRDWDPTEQLDLARDRPQLIDAQQRAARRELFGGDEAILIVRAHSSRARRIDFAGWAAQDILHQENVVVQGSATALQLALPVDQIIELQLRLQVDGDAHRILGDLEGMETVVGASAWTQRGGIALDLRSGALLAAIQIADGAPEGPVDWLHLRIEPQRPAEAP